MPPMPQMLRESHIYRKTAAAAENSLHANFATRKFPEDLAGVTPKLSARPGEKLGFLQCTRVDLDGLTERWCNSLRRGVISA